MRSKGFIQHIFVDYQNSHEVQLERVKSKFLICNLRQNISRLWMKCNGHSTSPISLKISGIIGGPRSEQFSHKIRRLDPEKSKLWNNFRIYYLGNQPFFTSYEPNWRC